MYKDCACGGKLQYTCYLPNKNNCSIIFNCKCGNYITFYPLAKEYVICCNSKYFNNKDLNISYNEIHKIVVEENNFKKMIDNLIFI